MYFDHSSKTVAILFKHSVGKLNRKAIAGTERVFLEDVQDLRKAGLRVKAYARFRSEKHKVRKIYYPLFILRFARIFFDNPVKRKTKAYSILNFISEFIYTLQFVILSLKSDILIGYSTPLLSIFIPKKTVVFIHNTEPFYFKRFFKSKYELTRFVFCSESLKRQVLVSNSQLNKNLCKVIYNAVDKKIFRPVNVKRKSSKLKLLYCGAWAKVKGLDILVDAIKLLDSNICDDIRLEIAGDRNLWYEDFREESDKYIRDTMKKISLMKNVFILGNVTRSGLPEVYSRNDYLLFPSVWEEPFGLVVLESLACGTPVIYFGRGGTGEIVTKSNSVLVKQINLTGLSRSIKKLYKKRKTKDGRYKKSLLTAKNKMMVKEVRSKILFRYLKELF